MENRETLLRLVEDEIGRLPLDDMQPQGLYAPIRYILEDGGKRIRPLLCLMGADLYSGVPRQALSAAVAVEVFHNFTLLHDDIMDKAELRRGRPTVHLKWGESGAILSGDAMLILAYQILQRGASTYGTEKLPQLLAVFNRAAMEVCQGQQYDMDFENSDRPVTHEAYIEMIRLKTSVLLAAALEMGAVVGGASEDERRALYDFGVNLGLAFQIQDDLLDTYGDAQTFGKKIGGDIVNNKKSWLLTRALEKSGEMEKSGVIDPSFGKKALLTAMHMPVANEQERLAKIKRVREIYEAIGVDEDAKYEIIKQHATAMDHAGLIGLGKVRYEMLHRYADKLLGRNR